MGQHPSLAEHLAQRSSGGDLQGAMSTTILRLADAAAAVAELIAAGPLAGELAAVVGNNADGDAQKMLDVRANDQFTTALRLAPVALVGSEEEDLPVRLDDQAPLVVAIDPLDGSSNIDVNVSVGTIFSIYPRLAGTVSANAGRQREILQPGADQLAAGFFVYGPCTALVLTTGQGTDVFTLDRRTGDFVLTAAGLRIPDGSKEYAINASNYRYWEAPVRAFIDDCVSGAEGPRGANYNMRWVASLVAEAYRILIRGGIFLYPRDSREGYGQGRLRLVYEANAIAFLIEQAGGQATDGVGRILEIQPSALHQRVPLIFGAREKVERLAQFHATPQVFEELSPLFGERSLFRH